MWDEWMKNTLHAHSEAYSQQYAGVWSGPDTYASVLEANTGAAQPAYGLHNGWSHTVAPLTVPDLLGWNVTHDGMVIRPQLPLDAYTVDSYLFGFSRVNNGTVEGGVRGIVKMGQAWGGGTGLKLIVLFSAYYRVGCPIRWPLPATAMGAG